MYYGWLALSAALLVSVVSLSGAFTLWLRADRLRRITPILVSLAVGVLLGDAFLHLIPDAAETLPLPTVCLMTLAGILLFFGIEKIVRWRHRHDVADPESAAPSPMAQMSLTGDAVHNFADGVLIAGSFAANPWLGFATTAAIIAHEVPQEIADVGALIQGGCTPRRAVVLNFLCSLTVVLGVVATLLVGIWASEWLPYLLPVAAGAFIYVAAADFIPALHAEESQRGAQQWGMTLVGVCCMFAVTAFEELLPIHHHEADEQQSVSLSMRP